MKKILLLVAYILLLTVVQKMNLMGQVYVNVNASGSGNGTNWTDAYTSITSAVGSASDGSEIWIAKGKYILDQTLEIENKRFKIYGSFNGNETTTDGRDFDNETIISGDINDDDDPSNLMINLSDNLDLVVQAAESGEELLIDGVVIEGGRGELEGNFSNEKATGGGMILIGNIKMLNCKVRNNLARFGGGIYIRNVTGSAPNIKFESCSFSGNRGIKWGGAVYAAFGGTTVSFEDCTFTDNECEFGATVYTGGSSAMTKSTYKGCRFENNKTSGNGAGLSLDGMVEALVDDCVFSENESERGAGLFIGPGTNAQINNCTFTNNKATGIGLGGGAYMGTDTEADFANCTFTGNSSIGAGGGFFSLGDNVKVSLTSSNFTSNTTTGFGGAIFAQDETELNMNGGIHKQNDAFDGGAIYVDGCKNTTMKNLIFEENTAKYSGAIDIEDCHVIIEQSEFKKNIADTLGGALITFNDGTVDLLDCLFEENEAVNDWGGALFLIGSQNMTNRIIRSQFRSNKSFEAAGAIYHDSGNLEMVNSLFYNNVASDGGFGNALSTNQTSSTDQQTLIVNCSFLEDAGGLGTIAPWAGENAKTNLSLQNNIFAGDGDHIVIEGGDVSITSKGGNLAANSSSATFLNNSLDFKETDPKFTDGSNGDLTLQNSSPCIDAGVKEGAPNKDINGNNRDDLPDIGAYEAGAVTSIFQLKTLDGEWKVFGNPTTDYFKATWNSETRGTVFYRIIDLSGNTIHQTQIEKKSEILELSYPTGHLPAGNYKVQLIHQDKFTSVGFMKT